MSARILTIHKATVEIDGRLFRFFRKTMALSASATPNGSRLRRSQSSLSPPSGLRSSRGRRHHVVIPQAAIDAYLAGESYSAVAGRFDISPYILRRHLKREGLIRPPGPRLTDYACARADDFRRRYLAGETPEAISKDYGISRERVRQILRKHGVPSLGRRGRIPKPLTETEREIAHLYDQGTPPKEIRARYGVTNCAISYACKRAGVKSKPMGTFNIRPDDAELTAEVARLYTDGMGATEIVKRLPQLRFPETVYRYLKRAGVPARRSRAVYLPIRSAEPAGELANLPAGRL